MKNQEQLINNIIGQLNGIKKMMEEDKECFSIIIQMKAVRSAMNNVMNKFIEENFNDCLDSCQSVQKKEMLAKLVKELVNVA